MYCSTVTRSRLVGCLRTKFFFVYNGLSGSRGNRGVGHWFHDGITSTNTQKVSLFEVKEGFPYVYSHHSFCFLNSSALHRQLRINRARNKVASRAPNEIGRVLLLFLFLLPFCQFHLVEFLVGRCGLLDTVTLLSEGLGRRQSFRQWAPTCPPRPSTHRPRDPVNEPAVHPHSCPSLPLQWQRW